MPARQSESYAALTFGEGVTQGGQCLKAGGEVVGHGAVCQVSKGVPQCGQLPVQDGQHSAWVCRVDHQVVQPAAASPSQKPEGAFALDIAACALIAMLMQQEACLGMAINQSLCMVMTAMQRATEDLRCEFIDHMSGGADSWQRT